MPTRTGSATLQVHLFLLLVKQRVQIIALALIAKEGAPSFQLCKGFQALCTMSSKDILAA